MMKRLLIFWLLILVNATTVFADDGNDGNDANDGGDKLVSGMSIVGNDEAPKALVIVPWKSSAMGDTLDLSRVLDDGRNPVDKEVFMRELDYYRIRAGQP
jgi:hypothetical protein